MPRPVLVIHGGAGEVDPNDMDARASAARAALDAGWKVLVAGGTALDAVCQAVTVLEDDTHFNAGRGSCLTSAGTVEMDASVMEGATLRAGAVALIRGLRNPVQAARAVADDGRFVFLAGEGAEELAAARGVARCTNDELILPQQLTRLRQQQGSPGTVGAVAVDRDGHVAAATSTGGVMGKHPGRIGDAAIIGAGTYADDSLGAASATGEGEAILRVALCRSVLDQLRDATDPSRVVRQAVAAMHTRVGGRGGVILVDPSGRIGYAHNTAHMTFGYMRADLAEALVAP